MIFQIAPNPGIDWEGFNPRNPAHVQRIRVRLNEFMRQPSSFRQQVAARLQEFNVHDDTSELFDNANVVALIQSDVGEIDVGWQQAFSFSDMVSTHESGFDVIDISSGLAFRIIKEGERADIYQVRSAKERITFDLYGGGLGMDLTWWMDQKFYNVEHVAADYRFKHFDEMADNFYALINSAGAAIAFDASLAKTMSNGVADMLEKLDGKLPITAQATFLAYYNPFLQHEVFAALNEVIAHTSQRSMQFNIVPVMSQKISDKTKVRLVLPGRKSRWANRMNLTILNRTNIDTFTYDEVGWARYAGVLNSDQVRELATS